MGRMMGFPINAPASRMNAGDSEDTASTSGHLPCSNVLAIAHQPMIRSVLRTSKHRQQAVDLAFWLSRPMAERIAAVEVLRQQAAERAQPLHAEPRLQRVWRVVPRRVA
jgi:hypothetical protein